MIFIFAAYVAVVCVCTHTPAKRSTGSVREQREALAGETDNPKSL